MDENHADPYSQAMSTSYHDDRIKLTLVLHSGVVEDSKAYLLKELNKYPIAYIIGGPKDIAYNNVSFRTRYARFRFHHIFHVEPLLMTTG
jgi:hypothetical protein